MSPMVYWSGKIPSVLSQAVNPLCPSTMKYTKEILKKVFANLVSANQSEAKNEVKKATVEKI